MSGIQPCGFLLELSLDWIVLRASENCHKFLGESHVTMVGEPLGEFVQADALHDLRNLFSRFSGSASPARTYRIRLTDDRPRFDIAFQQIGDRVLLEGVQSPEQGLGDAFSAVGGLAAGLAGHSGKQLLEGAARRMRALTAFDRVTFLYGRSKATSSRSGVPFEVGANASLSADFPQLVVDSRHEAIPIFPRNGERSAVEQALLRAPSAEQMAELRDRGFGSTMRIPVCIGDQKIGEFRCAHTTPRQPSFELHASAELFAQMVAMRLEVAAPRD